MNKIIVVILGALVAGGTFYVYANNQKEAAMAEQKMIEKEIMEKKAMEEKELMEQEEVQKEDETMTDKDESMMDKSEKDIVTSDEAMMKMGSYEAYSPEKIARAETGDVVLFFHASWCPSCRGLNASIETDMKTIPEGVSILKVDYDTETELKKKYGVTYQHTLVQVDKDGNLLKKWSGSGSLAKLVAEVQ